VGGRSELTDTQDADSDNRACTEAHLNNSDEETHQALLEDLTYSILGTSNKSRWRPLHRDRGRPTLDILVAVPNPTKSETEIAQIPNNKK